MDNFDSISDQIIEWASKSEKRDGLTLKQVVKLILKEVQEEAAYSETYARLCRKMFEHISHQVQDETMHSSERRPTTGGMLFRKYLLNQCEEFEQGWSGKETASKVDRHIVPRWGGPWRMIGAGRQGLGMAWFMGELWKLQMLTGRIMHEYIKRLLSKFVDPKEEDIEGLCKLLTIVGPGLDKPKAENHMDGYFERMEEITKGSNIDSRMRFMLLEIIELRVRRWQARPTCAIASIAGAKQQGRSVRNEDQRDGSRLGEHPDTSEPEGRNVAGGLTARPPVRAGDLSQFGKSSKPTSVQFGPSSVFSKKNSKREVPPTHTGGTNNMFPVFQFSNDYGLPAPARGPAERTPAHGKEESPTAVGARSMRKKKLLPKKKGNASAPVDLEPGGSLSAEGDGRR